MFNQRFNYAIATRVVLLGLLVFTIGTCVLILLLGRPQLAGVPAPVVIPIEKTQVVSLYKYVHARQLQPPSFERSIWDALFLANGDQRAALGRSFPAELFVFNEYALAVDKDEWFSQKGIILISSGATPPMAPAVSGGQ